RAASAAGSIVAAVTTATAATRPATGPLARKIVLCRPPRRRGAAADRRPMVSSLAVAPLRSKPGPLGLADRLGLGTPSAGLLRCRPDSLGNQRGQAPRGAERAAGVH